MHYFHNISWGIPKQRENISTKTFFDKTQKQPFADYL